MQRYFNAGLSEDTCVARRDTYVQRPWYLQVGKMSVCGCDGIPLTSCCLLLGLNESSYRVGGRLSRIRLIKGALSWLHKVAQLNGSDWVWIQVFFLNTLICHKLCSNWLFLNKHTNLRFSREAKSVAQWGKVSKVAAFVHCSWWWWTVTE